MITVRLPRATRVRLEALARREGRSLSRQVERLIERGLVLSSEGSTPSRSQRHPLSGALRDSRVPTLAEFRGVREALAESLAGRLA
jgi:hypothetical protein